MPQVAGVTLPGRDHGFALARGPDLCPTLRGSIGWKTLLAPAEMGTVARFMQINLSRHDAPYPCLDNHSPPWALRSKTRDLHVSITCKSRRLVLDPLTSRRL